MRRANGDASRLGAVGLTLLATALLAGRLAEGDLIGDPVIYAAVAKSMLVRGEWATQYLAGQPFFDKPPLVAWLAALAFHRSAPSSSPRSRSSPSCCPGISTRRGSGAGASCTAISPT